MQTDTPIHAVVFDLDDTLYPERQYVRSGYRAVAEHLGREPATDGPFEEWLWQRFTAGQRGGAFDALSEHFRLGLSKEQILQLVAVYREHAPAIRPYDGVVELLADLRGPVLPGVLGDGFARAQRLKLDVLGVGRFFNAVIWTDELGPDRECWKPSPAGFEAVARRLNVPHEACTYVADNPAKDFVAPNRLGWRTIQIRLPGQIHADNPAPPGGRPAATARSWQELRSRLGL